jgi:phosphate acyltransferase
VGIASDRIVIALDTMGGEHAPDSVLKAADAFAAQHKDVSFLLFGKEEILSPKLTFYPHLLSSSHIHHAATTIHDRERPSFALRKGKQSSMYMAIDAVRHKRAQAVISGGNTGALMAMAKLLLRTIPGIDRPAICSLFPTRKGHCVLLDLGANIDCNSDNLVQFALMGDAFAKVTLGIPNPKIGLLNVGVEETKGSEIVKTAAQEIREGGYSLNFHGYIEGSDIAQGVVDVVVTDGFTGNVALKSAEGVAKICSDYIRQAFSSSFLAFLGGILAQRSLKKMFKKMDPRLHNGAMFVGLNGITVKSHGSIDHIGFENAIKVTYDLAKNKINERISAELAEYNDTTLHTPPLSEGEDESADFSDGE